MDRFDGDHVTMLDLPKVVKLARIMLESLRQASASTRVGRSVATLRDGWRNESRSDLRARNYFGGWDGIPPAPDHVGNQ